MKEHPILSSASMILAAQAGLKTQTRRLFGVDHPAVVGWEVKGRWAWPLASSLEATKQASYPLAMRCPFGQPGELLWFRENFRLPKCLDTMNCTQVAKKAAESSYTCPWAPIRYEADGMILNQDKAAWGGEWGRLRVARFMPRWASRYTAPVVAIRLERVQAITEADAKAEGIRAFTKDGTLWKHAPALYRLMQNLDGSQGLEMTSAWAWADMKPTARQALLHLFYSQNKSASADTDPWVWIVTFGPLTLKG